MNFGACNSSAVSLDLNRNQGKANDDQFIKTILVADDPYRNFNYAGVGVFTCHDDFADRLETIVAIVQADRKAFASASTASAKILPPERVAFKCADI